MKLTKSSKRIADVVTVGLIAVCIAAFTLSYSSLVIMGLEHGLSYLSYLWPLCLDLLMVIGCLTVIRFSMLKENTIFPWAIVVATTAASTAFNVASVWYTQNPLTMCMYVVPPVTVFASLEFLIMIIKIEQKHSPAASRKPRMVKADD